MVLLRSCHPACSGFSLCWAATVAETQSVGLGWGAGAGATDDGKAGTEARRLGRDGGSAEGGRVNLAKGE